MIAANRLWTRSSGTVPRSDVEGGSKHVRYSAGSDAMPQEWSLMCSGTAAVQPCPRSSRRIEIGTIREAIRRDLVHRQLNFPVGPISRSEARNILRQLHLQNSESKDTRNVLVWSAQSGSV